MPSLIGQSLGRYHILEQLGEGGMATVYKAYDTRLERDVAIKIIRRGVFPSEQLDRILKRFEREAKALARLTHPNIVPVIDYGEYKKSPYLVMPYLSGGTLKQRLGKPMPWQEAVRILLPIVEALDYAHSLGIIHRDVKPSNILLTQRGQPMLTDFGIAKILESEESQTLTGTGVGVGTPEYMAPEQWTGQAVPQSDLYSLGVVLYELVTGRKPYTADTPAAILLKQATEALPRPRQYILNLPEEVEKVLFKALAKKPEDRYGDMGEFARALEGLLAGGTPSGLWPPTTSLRSGYTRPPTASHLGEEVSAERTPTRLLAEDSRETVEQAATRDELAPTPVPSAPLSPPAGKKVELSNKTHAPSFKWWIPVGVVLVLLGIGVALGSGLLKMGQQGQGPLAGLATDTRTLTLTKTPTHTMTPTKTHTPTASYTFTPTLTPTPGPGATQISEKDGMVMVYVPAGEFLMGSTDADTLADSDEKPQHTVYLDGYWIDRTEVTNGMYALCVQAGTCQPPSQTKSYTHTSYYSNLQFANYPVSYVDWNKANTYCGWAGRNLPSEAQWEKAARGMDGRIYPWGNDSPNNTRLNYSSNVGDTTAVGSYPSGASPYGALDMAGNVWEWVADRYDSNYYANSPSSNPAGPTSGDGRVLRGGSWGPFDNLVRSADRNRNTPTNSFNDVGFRCSRSLP